MKMLKTDTDVLAQNGTNVCKGFTREIKNLTEYKQAEDAEFELDGRTITDNQDLIEIYQDRWSSFGFDARTLLYPNPELHAAKLAQYVRVLHQLITPEDSVLDIGCGYGSLALTLPPCEYTGIDLVPEFIQYATDQFVPTPCEEVADTIKFQVCELEQCDSTYDWCILMGVLNSVANPDQILQQAWSRCRKGLVVDFNDCNKALETKYHVFKMGKCLEDLLSLEASNVQVKPTPLPWTIFIAEKSQTWLVKKQKSLIYTGHQES